MSPSLSPEVELILSQVSRFFLSRLHPSLSLTRSLLPMNGCGLVGRVVRLSRISRTRSGNNGGGSGLPAPGCLVVFHVGSDGGCGKIGGPASRFSVVKDVVWCNDLRIWCGMSRGCGGVPATAVVSRGGPIVVHLASPEEAQEKKKISGCCDL